MKQLEFMDEVELGEFMMTLAMNIELTCKELGVERPMFTLLLWNDPAVAQYISNCHVKGMIDALRETADRLEKKQNIPR